MLTNGPAPLRVRGLGPLRAFVGDEEIELGPPKQRATFAALALSAGTTVSRAELIDRVWGETVPATAAGSLHTYVSGLRRALGPVQELLVSDRAGYTLRLGREHVDVTRAEDEAEHARATRDAGAYERALRTWTGGTILAGVPGPFAAQARQRLGTLRVQLLVELAGVAAPDPALTARLLAEIPAHPLDERLRTATMIALHRAGRTAEALTQFEDLRHRLATGLGISPSPGTQAAYAAILAEDGDAARQPADAVPVRPAQLPPDRESFVGRSAELLSIVRPGAGAAGRRRIVLIAGAPGIGKTALAVRAGHLLRDSCPDGQIHLDLRGYDPSRTALTPDAALHELLVSAGARHIPAGQDRRAALWRDLTAGKRMLIILDNARSADQVEDLLPGGGLVIVTSRDRLSRLAVRHDATRVPLGALHPDESLHLLGTAAGAGRVAAEPEAARRLTALCDHSPLAIRIAAERIAPATGPCLDALVARLEDPRCRLDTLRLDDDPRSSVRDVLSWSVTALGTGPARAFRLLGVLPGTSVTRHTAAALFGTTTEQAGSLLDTLSASSLLEQDGDRFTMPELSRAYAAELSRDLGTPQRQAALSRILSWYRATLAVTGDRDRLRWCAEHRADLVALIHAAGQAGQHTAAAELTAGLGDHFRATGRPLEWLDLLRVAMRSAEATGDRAARAVLLHHSGIAYTRLGRHDVAVRQLTRGLELLAGTDHPSYRIGLLCSLTTALREMRAHDAARGPAAEALTLAGAAGTDEHLAAALRNRAELDLARGRRPEAVRNALTGPAHARAARRRTLEAALLVTVGRVRLGLAQRAAAREAFAAARRISRDAGDHLHEGRALFGLARCREPGTGPARQALARLAELDPGGAAEVRAFLAGPGIEPVRRSPAAA
ncbi:hypothetical protein GCM10010443_28560 [Actinoplanes cyaneus]|uniref:AfsR/SARP family transcriptional regulator n=1 Tax=Actinoplanes cyaneus TaxID=52696 RepID=UPI0031DBE6C1